VLSVILPAVAATCFAHPSALDREVGRRALPWLPPDLARQVVRHERDFADGAADAARWPRSFHQPGGQAGLEKAIQSQCERLAKAIRSRAPFAEVVAGLGALAHLSADLNAPFLTAHANDRYAQSFALYVPTAAPRIPLVFYGLERTVVSGPASGIRTMLAARRLDADGLAGYVREDLDRLGGPPSWRALDDRSSSFGTASLFLNHAATDFANLVSWIWLHAGGLVPDIPAPPETVLVWKGAPQPREAPFTRLRLQ
jgi:hypothetical protein